MGPGHVCSSFSLRSDTFYVEDDGKHWVLHVLDVGEDEDVYAIFLTLAEVGHYQTFQKDFEQSMMLTGPSHPGAAACPVCKPSRGLMWLPMFSDWVKAAYACMAPPPKAETEIPDVVRMSFESLVTASAQESQSRLD